MNKMRNLLGLALAAGAALSLTAPAFASDYSFSTTAPQDYYGSTSYEDVYGTQYNYGGRNAVDYDVPELEYGRFSTIQAGIMERTILPGLQGVVSTVGDPGGYGIGGGGGGPLTELVIEGAGTAVTPTPPSVQQPAYTSVQGTTAPPPHGWEMWGWRATTGGPSITSAPSKTWWPATSSPTPPFTVPAPMRLSW